MHNALKKFKLQPQALNTQRVLWYFLVPPLEMPSEQAEKLKSHEMKEGWMKDEWIMMKDERWRMMISSCLGTEKIAEKETLEHTGVGVKIFSSHVPLELVNEYQKYVLIVSY